MKKITLKRFQVQSQFSFKGVLCLCAVLLMSTQMSWGQGQVVGPFPQMDGGLEGQTGTIVTSAIDPTITGIKISSGSTSNNTTNWTTNGSGAGTNSYTIVDATKARSGSKFMHISATGSGITSPVSFSNYPQKDKKYIIQYYYNTLSFTNGDNTAVVPAATYKTSAFQAICVNTYSNLVPPSTTAGNANYTQTITNKDVTDYAVSSGWQKFYTSFTYTYTPGANPILAGYAGIRPNNAATGFPLTARFDDFCIYEPTEFDAITGEGLADIIAPAAPTAPIVSGTTGRDVSWTAPATGVDGGGYLVVRYATTPNADNNPNVNGIYGVGNVIKNGTGSLPGTVVYVGTGVSFNDPAGTATDFYRIYTVDKAFNYSVAATTSLGVNNFSSKNSVNVFSNPGKISLSNVISSTQVEVYSMTGALVKSVKTETDTNIDVNGGVYVVKVKSAEGTKSVKVIVK